MAHRRRRPDGRCRPRRRRRLRPQRRRLRRGRWRPISARPVATSLNAACDGRRRATSPSPRRAVARRRVRDGRRRRRSRRRPRRRPSPRSPPVARRTSCWPAFGAEDLGLDAILGECGHGLRHPLAVHRPADPPRPRVPTGVREPAGPARRPPGRRRGGVHAADPGRRRDGVRTFGTGGGITAAESRFLADELYPWLQTTVRRAAINAGVNVVDVTPALERAPGVRRRAVGQRAASTDGDGAAGRGSFLPNAAGHAAIAAYLRGVVVDGAGRLLLQNPHVQVLRVLAPQEEAPFVVPVTARAGRRLRRRHLPGAGHRRRAPQRRPRRPRGRRDRPGAVERGRRARRDGRRDRPGAGACIADAGVGRGVQHRPQPDAAPPWPRSAWPSLGPRSPRPTRRRSTRTASPSSMSRPTTPIRTSGSVT